MPTVREVIKHLKSYKPDEHIATAIWCEEDVLGRAKERHIPITRQDGYKAGLRAWYHLDNHRLLSG
jgi:hypothetical protein